MSVACDNVCLPTLSHVWHNMHTYYIESQCSSFQYNFYKEIWLKDNNKRRRVPVVSPRPPPHPMTYISVHMKSSRIWLCGFSLWSTGMRCWPTGGPGGGGGVKLIVNHVKKESHMTSAMEWEILIHSSGKDIFIKYVITQFPQFPNDISTTFSWNFAWVETDTRYYSCKSRPLCVKVPN